MNSIPKINLDPIQNFSEQDQNYSIKTKKILLIIGIIFVVVAIGGIYFWKGNCLKDKVNKLLLEYDFLHKQQENKRENTNSEASAIKVESDVLFPVLVKGNWGYINMKGELIILPKFKSATQFSEGLAQVTLGSKKGFIDKTGNMVIDLSNLGENMQDVWASDFSEGMADIHYKFNGESKTGYIDKTGKVAIDLGFALPIPFSEGKAAICKNEKDGEKFLYKCGYIDKTGKTVIDFSFSHAQSFVNGLAPISIGSKYGFIDSDGKIIIEPQFSIASEFSEDLSAVCIESKCGYIDKIGKFIIPAQFTMLGGKFSNGLAKVSVNNKLGFVDKAGKIVIDPQFYSAGDFIDGLARVVIKEGGIKKTGFIDTFGKIIISLSEIYYDDFFNGLASFRVPTTDDPSGLSKMGYIDITGKSVWNPEYISESALKRKDKMICDQDVIILTPTIKDLEKAAIFSLENNCEKIGSDINLWNNKMDTETKDMLLNTLKKNGILVPDPQKFDEQKDNNVEARICFEDVEAGLICAPVKLVKGISGDWVFLDPL